MFSSKRTRVIAAGVAAIAIGGGAYGIVSATASTGSGTATSSDVPPAATSGRPVPVAGIERSIRTGRGRINRQGQQRVHVRLHVLTSAGEKVTVKETSSTTYEKGTNSASASAVTTASRPRAWNNRQHDDHGHAGHRATDTQRVHDVLGQVVIPFKRGAPSTSKQVGQIPANYTQGSGTIASGTTANKATEAALAAYPGRHRRPCCEAEQRRVRGPQHRRQLAPPHLRQQGLQGRRRRPCRHGRAA